MSSYKNKKSTSYSKMLKEYILKYEDFRCNIIFQDFANIGYVLIFRILSKKMRKFTNQIFDFFRIFSNFVIMPHIYYMMI